MTDEERTALITTVRHGDAGLALIEYLALRQRMFLTRLSSEVDPESSGMVGRLQGAIMELNLLETILKADFQSTVERLEREAA